MPNVRLGQRGRPMDPDANDEEGGEGGEPRNRSELLNSNLVE